MATQVTLNSGSVDSAGSLLLKTNGTTTAITIDTSQNVGVGVTPSAWNASSKAFQIGTSGNVFLENYNGVTYILGYNAYRSVASGYLYTTTAYSASLFGSGSTGGFQWNIAPSGTAGTAITFTQAMTLDSSGNLMVGKTVSGQILTNGFEYNNSATYISSCSSTAGNTSGYFANTAGSGTRYLIRFYGTSAEVGKITHDGTNTTYATSSDYRLKENIAPMTGALSTVSKLKPCTYTWKSNNATGQGFIAHELQEVCPQAVVGDKDAVDKDGNPDYQGIDTSFLVATLTAAIQEQQALITTLTARITALESA